MVFLYRQGSASSKRNYLSIGWRNIVIQNTGITEERFEAEMFYNENSMLYDLGYHNFVLGNQSSIFRRHSLDLLYRYFSALQGFQKLCIANPTWKTIMTDKMKEWEASSAPDVIERNALFSVTLWSVLNDLRSYQNNATAETDPTRKAAAQKRVDDFNAWKPILSNRFISLVQNDLFEFANCLDFPRYYNQWIKNTLQPSDPQVARWEQRLASLDSKSKEMCQTFDTITTSLSSNIQLNIVVLFFILINLF